MAHSKLAFASIILVLSLFHCIHSGEGRNLKHPRKNGSPKLVIPSVIDRKQTKVVADRNSYFHVESTNRPSISNESVPMSPMPPTLPMSPTPPSQTVVGTRPPPPGHVDDFRPTAPGHSPGVGHSLKN